MQTEIRLETIADMFTATIEGGIMLARNFDDNRLLVEQILAYRDFIRMLYGATQASPVRGIASQSPGPGDSRGREIG